MKSNAPSEISKNIYSPQRFHKYQLWIPLAVAVLFSVIIIIGLGVPDRLNVSVKAKKAMETLDQIRQQMIEVQKIERHSIESGGTSMVDKLDTAIAENQLLLAQLKQNTAYDTELSAGIVQFLQLYYRWIDKKYVLHADRIMDASHFLEHASTGKLFITALTLLHECEQLLHVQMSDGFKVLKIIQWLLIALLLYIVIVAFMYQRFTLEKLKIQEKQLSITLESITDAVITSNLQGQVIAINTGGEQLTGVSKDDAIGKPLAFLFKQVIMHEDEMMVKKQGQDNPIQFSSEILLTASNGRQYRVINSGATICDESGHITGIINTFRDVTQEYGFKNRAHKQAERLQQTIDSTLDAVIVTDEKGTILEWNERAEEIFGWSFNESITQSIHGLILSSESRKDYMNEIQKLVDAGEEPRWEKRLTAKGIHKQGYVFPIDISMTSIQHAADGSWYFCAFIRDLTDIENVRLELVSNKKLFDESQRVASLGNWEFEHVNNKLLWSDEVYQIFALDVNDAPCYKAFMNFVHPEDRGRVEQSYTDAFKSRQPYNIIHRIILKDGSIKFVHQISETIYDGETPVRTIGTIQEITNRIIADEKLWQAATNIETLAGIIITDTKGVIIKANNAFEMITGYAERELIGKNPKILSSGKQDTAFYDDMWMCIKNTDMWQGELWNKHKNGHLYAEWLTITAIKDELGVISHYVGTVQDITNRKQAEAYVEHLSYYEELASVGVGG